MDAMSARDYALALAGVTEDMPFGDDVLTLRVGGKIFLLMALGREPMPISLKCDPAWALELRAAYRQIEPGYHMNKKHWNTVRELHTLPSELLRELLHHSYTLVFNTLPRRVQREIAASCQP